MTFLTLARLSLACGLVLTLSACGGGGFGSGNLFGKRNRVPDATETTTAGGPVRAATAPDEFVLQTGRKREREDKNVTPIQSLFYNSANPNTTLEVNKYIWEAAKQVLDFMPIQSIDPFSGVIVYGFGTPPGGGAAYRATVFVQDPALDARSLKVALVGRGGPVSADVQRAVEDAILTRARQLRIRDIKL
jgi:hypothetical protein